MVFFTFKLFSVGPLETPGWSNRARSSVRQAFKVRARRFTSGTGALLAGLDRADDDEFPGLGIRVVVGGHELLGDPPGGGHFVVGVAGGQRGGEFAFRGVGEPVMTSTEQPTPPIQRVVDPATVPGRLVLDPASDVIDAGQGQFHDMKRVKYPGRCGKVFAQGGGVAAGTGQVMR